MHLCCNDEGDQLVQQFSLDLGVPNMITLLECNRYKSIELACTLAISYSPSAKTFLQRSAELPAG